MRVLKIIGIAFGGLVLLVAGVFVGARFADGPLGPVPGGPFASGEWVEEPVSDWSFAADEETVELQLLGGSTSRTTWILVRNGEAFIPCSLGFPPGKRWHLAADRNGDAVVRIAGRRYPVSLARLDDAAVEEVGKDLLAIVDAKYGGGPPTDAGVWFFALHSRAR